MNLTPFIQLGAIKYRAQRQRQNAALTLELIYPDDPLKQFAARLRFNTANDTLLSIEADPVGWLEALAEMSEHPSS